MTKDLRNIEIIKMHNSGLTVRDISNVMSIGKSAVHKIITAHLDAIVPSEQLIEIKPTIAPGKIFSSFVGWVRLGVNQYSNKDTGEVVNVKFVPSIDLSNCGHFITV